MLIIHVTRHVNNLTHLCFACALDEDLSGELVALKITKTQHWAQIFV